MAPYKLGILSAKHTNYEAHKSQMHHQPLTKQLLKQTFKLFYERNLTRRHSVVRAQKRSVTNSDKIYFAVFSVNILNESSLKCFQSRTKLTATQLRCETVTDACTRKSLVTKFDSSSRTLAKLRQSHQTALLDAVRVLWCTW